MIEARRGLGGRDGQVVMYPGREEVGVDLGAGVWEKRGVCLCGGGQYGMGRE